MTVLADTSAWVEFLRATGGAANVALREFLVAGDLATTDAVVLEVLAGANDARQSRDLVRLLDRCRWLPQEPWADAELAASMYAACRERGQTPRSLLDCLIGAVAVRCDVPVLHRDRDYDLLASHTALRVSPMQ
jgi:predicted nucleic acid-binding protein